MRAELILPLRATTNDAGKTCRRASSPPATWSPIRAATAPPSPGHRRQLAAGQADAREILRRATPRHGQDLRWRKKVAQGAQPMIPLLPEDLLRRTSSSSNNLHGVRTASTCPAELRAEEAIYAGAHFPWRTRSLQGPVFDSFVKLMAAKRHSVRHHPDYRRELWSPGRPSRIPRHAPLCRLSFTPQERRLDAHCKERE